ncbi:hypothetical protein [Cryobacterium sp. M23]|uniref:hypothetical protein n=1 Tax=Cryobacterium sp. M23 TaxID=2048292 RepID=UPI000CE478FE|nr:hypothetical protein [Cryobacterium sp. M23]
MASFDVVMEQSKDLDSNEKQRAAGDLLRSLGSYEMQKGVSEILRSRDAPGKAKAIEDATALPKGDAARTTLLIILMVGLFAIAVMCVWGGITAKNASSAAPLYLIATAVVSGTLGLFAKSPISGRSDS